MHDISRSDIDNYRLIYSGIPPQYYPGKRR